MQVSRIDVANYGLQLRHVYRRLNSELDKYIVNPPRYAHHREIMRQVLIRTVFHQDPRIDHSSINLDEELTGLLEDLINKQDENGIFSSQENLFSPPDTSFSIHDGVMVWHLLKKMSIAPKSFTLLTQLISRAAKGLAQGGIHTPNHRWEVSSALAGLSQILDNSKLMNRAYEWLGENIDIYPSGSYSERSANYAAYVSNPSLLSLAQITGEERYREIVHKNLHQVLRTTSPDGVVDTVYSRRQDQFTQIRIGIFAPQLIFTSSHFRCPQCAQGAYMALQDESCDDFLIALNRNLNPQWDHNFQAIDPVPIKSTRSTDPDTGLTTMPLKNGGCLSIYSANDIGATDSIQSGLNVNPTVFQVVAPAGRLFSARLSREFFNIGPFRGKILHETNDQCVLQEKISAKFYQPLPPDQIAQDGRYLLTDDGRFSAEMSFNARPHDTIQLNTWLDLSATDTGFDLSIHTAGAKAWHSLELAFPHESVSTSYESFDEDRYCAHGSGTIVTVGTPLNIDTSFNKDDEYFPFYNPGETFSVTRGSDAMTGKRVYITWRSPGKKLISFHF